MATKQKILGPPKAPKLYDVQLWSTIILPGGRRKHYQAMTLAYAKPFALARALGRMSVSGSSAFTFYKLAENKPPNQKTT